MSDEQHVQAKSTEATPVKEGAATPARRPARSGGRSRSGGPRRKAGDRPAPEFAQKILKIRRVARVVAGGRRFSFSVAIVIGDKKGRVGVGLGKAGDTAQAIDKAVKNAKRNMITVPLTDTGSIAHEIDAKFGSSRVMLKPAPGRGLVAGSAVRSVLDLAGVADVNGKILSRSKNQLNNARTTVFALKQIT
ncbi:MAG: 30S ribosomal protein S5 [bacterium]|nr:30S ribosomal protein S5 [bacterium]